MGMTDSIKLDGLDPILKKLDGLSNRAISRGAMQKATAFVHRSIAKYPAKPAHSTYIRKVAGGLGGAWTTKISDGGRTGWVGNKTPYAIYVQGEWQTWFHDETGWVTVAEGAEKYAPEVIKIFEDAYNSYLERQ